MIQVYSCSPFLSIYKVVGHDWVEWLFMKKDSMCNCELYHTIRCHFWIHEGPIIDVAVR